MIWISVVLSLFVGIAIGILLTKKIMQRLISIDNQRTLNSKRNQFVEALGRIKAGESQFKTRMNDTVYIQVNLVSHGLVDVIYLIDRDDIAIFQNTTCLYTSDSVENEIIEQIIKSICLIYNKKINDVIEILGFVFYREDFEKSIGCKIDEIVKNPIFCKPEIQQEDIIQTKVFDIDELLDKISQYGLPALTPEEIDFLDNYSNDKRN
jgi:uncharacterized protein YneF (UPF0154 family)